MKFILQVEMGNDGMQFGSDVAALLRQVADDVDTNGTGVLPDTKDAPATLRDENGNRIGYYGMWPGVVRMPS